jgi:predicted amidophosphoribosyltransferase
MTTEQHEWASAQAAPAAARHSSPLVCGCGQDLDVCTGRHCPRCGATLHHVVAAA